MRAVNLLVYGVSQIFRWIPDKLEEAVIRGLVVDDDRALVDLAAHSDDVAADYRSIGDQARRSCVGGIVRRHGIAAPRPWGGLPSIRRVGRGRRLPTRPALRR